MLIETNGLAVTLFRKRIKNLNVRIQRTGAVQVSAPMALPLHSIHRFLEDKRAWIDFHRKKLSHIASHEQPQTLQQGDVLFFLGQQYALMIHETSGEPYIEVALTSVHFHVKKDSSVEQRQALLQHWYREHMQARLPALFHKWEQIISVRANTYGIRMMKTRWGSCNTIKKRIVLNLRLIQKPSICLEYVIVHELIHLIEASHNQRFHALMNQFMPDWKDIKKQLELTS